MTSPLQKRRQRIAVINATQHLLSASGDVDVVAAPLSNKSEWDVVRASIKKDAAALKNIKQIAEKNEYKARNLHQYAHLFEREALPLDIAASLMVWLFDCGDIQKAITLGLHCITHGGTMPEGFKPDIPTFMADTLFDWAEAQWRLGQGTEPYFRDMFTRVTGDWNLFDQITAKYLKLAGLMALGAHKLKVIHVSEPERLYAAKTLFQEAMKCYSKVGVSVRIDEIDKRLLKLGLPLEAETE
ncbi:hypothetical protein HWQ46_25320 [Shewanella sp. D64]|uniref:phage terminase small subunit n=1 Tax=unclassified Shewanella TaxID=196818 RepID=UPI0022BA375C|nr:MULTISPECIES: phage terminase small subunit [unclassified Shewanella]MEC4728839.1 hypothetical protein [Shewanella sp. D64]MEC4740713.1 hypothetical protein [Shewanella sp. E94]WBJ95328.1 hypothetical protein HWQ47_26665 [Shewanella sp. MTB7]